MICSPLAAGSQLISVAKNDLQTVVGPSSILQVLSEAQYQPENAILRGSAVFVQSVMCDASSAFICN